MKDQTYLDTADTRRSRTGIVLLTIAVLTTAFYFIEHRNYQRSHLEAFTITGEELSAQAAEGEPGRRVAIPAIGLFGVILLLLPQEKWRINFGSHLSWLVIAFFACCGASIVWSIDPQLTLRHLSVLVCCGLGIAGVSRKLTLREISIVALAGTTILVANSVCTELVLGTFRPWAADYRFAGTLHPNGQAPYCGVMAVAAAFLASHAKRGRLLLWTLCLIATILMVLTKSRTVCGSYFVGILIYKSLAISWKRRLLFGIVVLWIVSTVALAATVFNWDFERQAVNVALIGREQEAESLTGRVPLWNELIPFVEDRPSLGYGYMTFWTPGRIASFSEELQWSVPDGHCAYLDMLLEVGIVGASLCILTICYSLTELRRRILAGTEFGYGFIFVLLICRTLNGLLESDVAIPTSFGAFIVACGLSQLAFREWPYRKGLAGESKTHDWSSGLLDHARAVTST